MIAHAADFSYGIAAGVLVCLLVQTVSAFIMIVTGVIKITRLPEDA